MTDLEPRRVLANGININTVSTGDGPPVVLLHGWPHTWQVWQPIMPALAEQHRVMAMDLRGLGASDTPQSGFDLHTLADDVIGAMDALDIEVASLVGIDLSVSVAWMCAMRNADRVDRLVIMEGLLGRLPGAEAFLVGGPPWWFGFHAVPSLAETVIEGHVGEYLDFFFRTGTHRGDGISAPTRDAFVAAYERPESLRCGFEHYRALADNAVLVQEAAADHEIGIPVLAIGADNVKDNLAGQLRPITHDLRTRVIEQCGHIIPQDAPDALLSELLSFLGEGRAED